MSSRHKFEINYLYRNEPHNRIVESDDERLDTHFAALRLIALHHADAENSLVMPAVDASPEEIIKQAEVLGITDIRVSKLGRLHTPGHYQQP